MIRAVLAVLFVLAPALAWAQRAVEYHLSFPSPEHRWMQVEVVFADLPADPLQVRMSRSSPGRYALHEFAKNVFDVRATGAGGTVLPVLRPDPHGWDIAGHGGRVRFAYKVFGDRIDGTYLAIDDTHAHINMPAALVWARGLEGRQATVRFERPAGAPWRVATQLAPGPDPFTFTAPNLQYLMDSPAEFSDFAERTSALEQDGRKLALRIALHHTGTDAELDAFARDAAAIAREAAHVFGEYPRFDHGVYTVLADYLPWATGDGMEHRNSTVVSSPAALADARTSLLGTVAHEFFHAWNVERLRPRSLEPFRFDEANMSAELWFAEGFTSYYGELLMRRAGLTSDEEYAAVLSQWIDAVTQAPGRRFRTAEEMSGMAPFVDAAAAIDPTAFSNTYLSYYTWGAAIGLALDLSLRARPGGATLDDFMRAMWQRYGRPEAAEPGRVERPYSTSDLQAVLASVSGSEPFARDFFARYIQGHEVPDYRELLEPAGFVLKPLNPGAAWVGDVDVNADGRIGSLVPFGSPAYEAGLERGDVIVALGRLGIGPTSPMAALLEAVVPGEAVEVVFERRGRRVSRTIRPQADPHTLVVPAEAAAGTVSGSTRRFRDAWLSAQADRLLKSREP